MRIEPSTPLPEVARAVCTTLEAAGVTAVHWNDRSGLAQALAVARAVKSEIDFGELASWTASEGETDKYREFLARLDEGAAGPKAT